MFMGDLDRQGERNVIHRNPDLRVDVLKLGHHGSKTSSDPQFIRQLLPQIGIISAGRQNRYGHPNQETLITLRKIMLNQYQLRNMEWFDTVTMETTIIGKQN